MVIPYLIATAGLLFQGNVKTASNLAEFRAAVQSAKPGDRILLKSGTYDGGIFLTGVHGQAGRPIIIGGVNKDAPPILAEFTGQIPEQGWRRMVQCLSASRVPRKKSERTLSAESARQS